MTEAARELHYTQPSVSHHLSRLEAATGVKLVQRVGRGIRLTPEGQLLTNRATEIVGRVEAATSELAAQVGLRTGRVRLAANASTLSTIVALFRPENVMGTPERAGEALAEVCLGVVTPPPGRIYLSLVKGEPKYPDPSQLARSQDAQDRLWRASAAMVGID